MPNTTRQEIVRFWQQADNKLDRFLEELQQIDEIFDQANEEFDNSYLEFSAAVAGFAQIIIKTQQAWRELRKEKL